MLHGQTAQFDRKDRLMAPVELRIADDDLDPEARADLARGLLRELRDGDFDAELGRSTDEPPAGSRSGDALAAGLVLVQAVAEAGVLPHLFAMVKGWLGRNEVAEVEVRIGDKRLRLSQATPAQQQELIEHFITASRIGD
jgi:hypothetical protein